MQFLKNIFSKTLNSTLTVTSSNGFHLRPIARFISEAKKFNCDINASFHGKTVNAKSVNTLLSLNLGQHDSFSLSLKGDDAQEALTALTYTFQTLMHEDKEIPLTHKKTHQYEGSCIEGETIYEGIAIAPLVSYMQKENFQPNNLNFTDAITRATEELELLYTKHIHNDDASIYLAQKELLFSLTEKTHTLETFKEQIQKESNALKGGLLEAKIIDYTDILQRVKSHLGYSYKSIFPEEAFILFADDLLPSDILSLEKSNVAGVIVKNTSPTSHTAILLRATGIPSLILTEEIKEHSQNVILDTHSSILVAIPSTSDENKAKERQRLHQFQQNKSHAKRFQHAFSKAGKHIRVYANVSDIHSAHIAKQEGAEGIGLLRTEFLFDSEKPTLQTQKTAYEDIFALFSDITIRTLDVGGDKALPYINLPKEKNPFLGIRGVRLFKTHPELMEEQLYAIYISAKGKAVKIMFPMISTVEEFNESKKFALAIAEKHQIDISNILFGIMIEVPSVLFLLAEFNQVVDFYSIGTNDLTQYLFATERTHPTLKIDNLSPVIFSALKSIIIQADKPVSICGELASDRDAIPKLIELGLETLSVSPKNIAQTKQEVRHI